MLRELSRKDLTIRIAIIAGFTAVAPFVVGETWQYHLAHVPPVAIIFLSLVVLCGFGGQVSLCHAALAGFGAFVAAHLIADFGVPFNAHAPLASGGEIGGIILSAALGFSYVCGWMPFASDYSRYLPRESDPRAIFWWVFLGGFIPGGGSASLRVLLRALGPSLSQFGVPNPLADPTLELRDANGALVASNDDWRDDPNQETLIDQTGIPPSNDAESAIVATIPPALHTAIVAGKGSATGVALVEVYHLQ